jgi:hypothetical protein
MESSPLGRGAFDTEAEGLRTHMQQRIIRTAALAAWVSVATTGMVVAQAPATPAADPAGAPAAQGGAAKGDPVKAKAVLDAVVKAMGGDKAAGLT